MLFSAEPNTYSEAYSMTAKEHCVIGTAFMGTVQYRLAELMYEFYNPFMHDITGVFRSQRVDTNTNEETDCLAVVCMQLNPALLKKDEAEVVQPSSSSSASAASACSSSSSLAVYQCQHSLPQVEEYFQEKRRIFMARLNPDTSEKCIDCVAQVQDHTGFFPGGYLHLFAMTLSNEYAITLPSMRILKEDDLCAIKDELIKIQKDAQAQGYSIALADTPASSQSVYSSKYGLPLALDEKSVWYDWKEKYVYIPDRSVFHYAPRQRPAMRFEEDLVRSAFWKKLCRQVYCDDYREEEEEEEEEGPSSAKNQMTLCFRARQADVSADSGWTMVNGTSDLLMV